jgi:hypothetical protein
LEAYFGLITFWEKGGRLPVIFRITSGKDMVLHFPRWLPGRFSPLFDIRSIFYSSPHISVAVGLFLEKYWECFTVFISIIGRGKKFGNCTRVQIPNSLQGIAYIYMNQFYKSHAIDEWNRVQEKIPQHLGLFGTIFTTLACNIDSCSWHIDPCDLEFAVLIYSGSWQGARVARNPFRLVLNSLDILLLKSSHIFYFVRHVDGTRKNITIYSHLIKSIPGVIEERALPFLVQ